MAVAIVKESDLHLTLGTTEKRENNSLVVQLYPGAKARTGRRAWDNHGLGHSASHTNPQKKSKYSDSM